MPENNQDSLAEEEQFFKKVKIPFEQSKEEVWDSLSKKLDEGTPAKKVKIVSLFRYKMAAAAVITFLIGITFILKFYTNSITCKRGEQLSYVLPDGSTIVLNAESTIAYQPYWWYFKREVSFEGEGFFEVKKGSNFAVLSQKGTTQVLGTSFNISTRNNRYEVLCLTGKVRVSDNYSTQKVVLTPNMLAAINDKIEVSPFKEPALVVDWTKNKLNFTSRPVSEVFEVIERQYDIIIQNKKDYQAISYTGYFQKPETVESVLNLLGKTIGFTFVKIDDKTYKIKIGN